MMDEQSLSEADNTADYIANLTSGTVESVFGSPTSVKLHVTMADCDKIEGEEDSDKDVSDKIGYVNYETPQGDLGQGNVELNTNKDGKNEVEMENMAKYGAGGITDTSNKARLESEEFENISITGIEDLLKTGDGDGISSYNNNVDKNVKVRKDGRFDGTVREVSDSDVNVVADVIDKITDGGKAGLDNLDDDDESNNVLTQDISSKTKCLEYLNSLENDTKKGRDGQMEDQVAFHIGEKELCVNLLQEPVVSGARKVSFGSDDGLVISLKEHEHMTSMRRRSEGPQVDDTLKPPNTYRKHSSGDLHSRLKTRKLLGVGETDDGDVHRSKLSQILGHSDQLYIKLPGGLRLWQIFLAVLFSLMSLWALLFPSHYFITMYEIDSTNFTFPIRLYATALVCISVMYWSTIQAAHRDVIRMVLLSSIVFFTLKTLVIGLTMLSAITTVSRWLLGVMTVQACFALIGYYFHFGIVGPLRTGSIKRTTSNKELADKDQ